MFRFLAHIPLVFSAFLLFFTPSSVLAQAGPDLVPLAITAVVQGADVRMSDTIRNIGDTAAGPFDISYYFSSTPTPNPASDTLVGLRSVPGLAGGNAVDLAQTTLPIPPTQTGSYHVCTIVDSGNDVSEIVEDNNTTLNATPIVLGPDLLVLNLTVSNSSKTFNLSVSNRGAYYFGVIVDADNNIAETNEGNNIRSSTTTIDIP